MFRIWPIFALVIPIYVLVILSGFIALSVLISWVDVLIIWAASSAFLAGVFALIFEDD